MTGRVVVIGGGIGGSTAALRLANMGHEVVLLERGSELGGLVVSFEVGGTPIERAYHHLLPGEHEILELLTELNLINDVVWHPSSVAILTGGRVWPFTSPIDLLRFGPLPMSDRIRMGLGALRFGRVDDWEPLDTEPAVQWLQRLTSRRAREVVWEPLLGVKFGPAAPRVPAAWMWARFNQRAGTRRRGRESLGYLRGGFRRMFEALETRMREAGVDIRLSTNASRIVIEDGRVQGVSLGDGEIEADSVLFCGPLPVLPRLVPADACDPRWSAIGGLGVVCVVLEMTHPLTDSYWVNVCDPSFGFGGIIEHTNLVPASDYGGRNIAYLSRYFVQEEPIASTDVDQTVAAWLKALEQLPGFRPGAILGVHPFKTDYAAPLVTLGYRSRIPPIRSHIEGLFVCTTAQIYPRDRGMSEGVRLGTEAAAEITGGRPAVKGGR
jgi:protoporphyrinogen oxidase